jgi:FKBP-type peptidyl-prolyl cis-trans isomerase 2
MLKKGNKIDIHFKCIVDSKIIDNTYDREPYTIIIGDNDLVDGVEDQLIDMLVGEKRNIVITKENAYGDIQKDLFKVVDLNRIPENAELGNVIDGETEDGVKFQCFLSDIDKSNNIAILDFNHPLAGKELTFEIELLKIY